MIFDRQKLCINHDRAASLKDLSFFKNAADEIIDRLEMIDKHCVNILDINCRWGILTRNLKTLYTDSQIISCDISEIMLKTFEHEHKFKIDEENIASLCAVLSKITHEYFDLISFSLGMHSINDVQSFLKQIYYFLQKDGIFVGNFVGGKSLKNLRFKLFEIEGKLGLPHHSHIIPFINFEDIVPLLQSAGFVEIVVDYENIKLEFANPLDLMYWIQRAGESNFLSHRANYSLPKSVYYNLANLSEKFTDQIQLISFVATKNKNTIKLKSTSTVDS